MAEQTEGATQGQGRRELRLAVVCYGGVSLCIYMHGTTKELNRLVKASRLLAGGNGVAEAETKSERVYRELLEARAKEEGGVQTDVVVDIVAGTSAGGINGVFLAKALAHNLPQDQLRDLWLDKGDIHKLVRKHRFAPDVLVDLGQLLTEPPLRGDEMSLWLYDALEAMDDEAPGPGSLDSLVPDGQTLQLFVTMTDFFGYDRQVSTTDPKLAHDRRHRHRFEFRYGDGEDLFARTYNGALAFGARATSCFPGAFPPVSVGLFNEYLARRDASLGDIEGTFFREYQLSGASVDETYFVDGGVLDNRPFGHAIDAIRQQPADVEVRRRLLYLEPDPGKPAPAAPGRSPNPIEAVLGAVSGIPRREPILDDLLEVMRLNERVGRMADIVAANFGPIAAHVGTLLDGQLSGGDPPDAATLGNWARLVNEAARAEAGINYTTYIRSKLSGAVDRLAKTACALCKFPEDTNHAFLTRAALRCWAEEKGLFEQQEAPTQEQVDFLRSFDLGYGVRRLKFVIAGLNAWYPKAGTDGYPTRGEIDAVKAPLWAAIALLEDAMSGRGYGVELLRQVTMCFDVTAIGEFIANAGFEPAQYASSHAEELNRISAGVKTALDTVLQGFGATLFQEVHGLTSSWNEARRTEIVVRYLGFPFWDILLFPIQASAGAGAGEYVRVVRMSPHDAKLLEPPTNPKKLDGLGLMHFRAFFERKFRENDYLWGRLDGAERLIGLVLGADHPELRSWCSKAFVAILDEEEEALGTAGELIAALREQAGKLVAAGTPV